MKLLHQSATPEHKKKVKPSSKNMSGHTRLHRRKSGMYCLRAKVPIELQRANCLDGKREIFYSLRTKDYKEAVKKIKFETLKVDQLFENERDKIKQKDKLKNGGIRTIKVISENEVLSLVTKFFMDKEKRFAEWYNLDGINIDEVTKNDLLTGWMKDAEVYSKGTEFDDKLLDLSNEVNSLLKKEGIEIDNESSVFKKMHGLFRRINLEHTERKINYLNKGKYKKFDKYLWQYVLTDLKNSKGINKKKKLQITLEQLFERFLRDQKDAKVIKKTLNAYIPQMRAMKEVIGKDTDISKITRENIKELATFIKKLPPNAIKKFPNMTLKEIIKLTANNDEIPNLSAETAKNYYKNIIAIFNYAVKCNPPLLKTNPADDKWIRESFKFVRKPRKQFTTEELNKLISSPFFISFLDEKTYHSKNIKIGGKFWVFLLALYQGLRMNEACQLYTEDVKMVEDLESKNSYLSICVRRENDKGEQTEKRLKNDASKRIVPVHPELLRIGFKKMWEMRKNDKTNHRLFPDIKYSKAHENYSNKYSECFSEFKKQVLISDTNEDEKLPVFHSLRHTWRDRLRAAGINKEMVEILGGWKDKSSSEAGYGYGYSIGKKYESLSEIYYPNLKIESLHMFRGINKPKKLK